MGLLRMSEESNSVRLNLNQLFNFFVNQDDSTSYKWFYFSMYLERKPEISLLRDIVSTSWQSIVDVSTSTFIVPDGSSDIIIRSDANTTNIFLCGVMTKSKYINHSKRGERYLGLRFKPGFSSLFFNFKDPQNQLFDLNHVFAEKNQIADLMEDSIKNYSAIENLIYEQLLSNIDESDLLHKIKFIGECSNVQYGDVSAFADRLNISRKQFTSNFKKYFGYDPRYFSKIKKFNKVMSRISLDQSISLSELALDCGFYDQADLSHTVKEISGLTPKALISQVYNTIS